MSTTPLALNIPKEFLYLSTSEAIKGSLILKGVINKILRREIDDIERQLGGHALSSSIKSEIKGHLKIKESIRINVVLDDDLAQRIKNLCTNNNLVRDALFTRIWFYMFGSEKSFGLLNMSSSNIKDISLNVEYLSPIRIIADVMEDPFYWIREEMRNSWEYNEYTSGDFPGLYKVDLNLLNEYASDDFMIMTTYISEEQHEYNKKIVYENSVQQKKQSEKLISLLESGKII